MSEVVLVASQLTFAYPRGEGRILDGFDLEVLTGEMVAVTGPSGCGKSTLLYLLGLFLRPNHGQLEIATAETTELRDRERSLLRAHAIGFVLQDAALHQGMTLRDNVADGALYGGASRTDAARRADALLERYGLTDVAGHLPTAVSGGEAQRAALCRALIREPALILADEPTGNLDLANAERVVAGLRAAAGEGAAVVVVTPAPGVAGAADRAVALA